MKKIVKIGIIIILIVIVCIGITTALIKPKIKVPLSVVHLETSFEGIEIEVNTNKDVYKTGEDVEISLILTNTNDYDTTLYLTVYKLYKNHTVTDEIFTFFNVFIYNETYMQIWKLDMPEKLDEFWIPVSHNITINASTSVTFSNICIWNQTYGAWAPRIIVGDPSSGGSLKSFEGDQVPPGLYNIIVEIPIDMEHYFEPPYRFFTVGNSVQILII